MHNASLAKDLDKHKSVFEMHLGKVTGYEARIIVDLGALQSIVKHVWFHTSTKIK